MFIYGTPVDDRRMRGISGFHRQNRRPGISRMPRRWIDGGSAPGAISGVRGSA
jgi:hypothetical protein